MDERQLMTNFPVDTYKLLRDAVRKTLDAIGIDHFASQYPFWDTCFVSNSTQDLTQV